MAIALLEDDDAPEWLLERCTPGEHCWVWRGSRLERHRGWSGDRAVIAAGGRRGNVGRVLYEEFLGIELPQSLIIEHSCDNAICVKPSHLLLSTPAQNTARMVARGRARPGGQLYRPPATPKPRRLVVAVPPQVQ